MLWVAGEGGREGGREGVDLDLVECGPIESSGSTCVCFVSNGISLDYWQGHV